MARAMSSARAATSVLARSFALALLAATATDATVPTLTEVPLELVRPHEPATVSWAEAAVVGVLQAGQVPGVFTHTATGTSGGTLSFVAADRGLDAGTWYARIKDLATADATDLFAFAVESDLAPSVEAPANGTIVTEPDVLLRWSPVQGVPFYYVIVSDREIEIVTGEDDEVLIQGASVIWQALTAGNSLPYGAPDPSGFFDETNGATVPLIDGLTYNWIVLNAYGPNASLFSTVQSGVSEFSVDLPTDLQRPTLVAPSAGAVVSEETAAFEWISVAGAETYYLRIYELQVEDEGSGEVLLATRVTTEDFFDFPVGDVLTNGDHTWDVVAVDGQGLAVASERRQFFHSIQLGSLHVQTTFQLTGEGLPRADLSFLTIQGGAVVFPAATDDGGRFDRDLVPGTYRVTASKPGYEDAAGDVTIVEGQTTNLTQSLAESPATISGGVDDEAGVPVGNATVAATRLDAAGEREGLTTVGGSFVLGVTAGTWRVAAGKAGYQEAAPETVVISAGQSAALPDRLVLTQAIGTISGNVVNDQGFPVLAAAVALTKGAETAQAVTNGLGAFSVGVAAGDWSVRASKAGFIPTSPRPVSVAAGQTVTMSPSLLLTRQAGLVQGRVSDGLARIPGAVVTATPAAGDVSRATSGASGDFSLSLPPGTYVLAAGKTGYSPSAPTQVTLASGQTMSGLDLLLVPRVATVTGTVTRAGLPVSGATVTNGAAATATGADGAYSLSLTEGEHVLSALLLGFTASGPVAVSVAPGETVTGIDFQVFPNSAVIEGSVTAGGEPVVGAVVTAVVGAASATGVTDDLGDYALSVQPGLVLLTAAKEGFAAATRSLTVNAGETANDIDFELPSRSATIVGTVKDGPGNPLRTASVRATGRTSGAVTSTVTDRDGQYTLTVTHPDTVPARAAEGFDVRAEKAGFVSAGDTTVVLTSGSTATVHLTLIQGAVLSGVAMDAADASRLAHAVATLLLADTLTIVTAESDPAGAFLLTAPPGSYTLTVAKPGYLSQVSLQTLTIGGTHTVTASLTPAFAVLTGTVTDSVTTAPLAQVLVVAVSPSGSRTRTTDGAGAYSFTTLVPDSSYAVSFSLAGYRDSTVSGLSLQSGSPAALSLALAPLTGVIRGTVTTPAAAPLAAAAIRARDGGGALVGQTESDASGAYVLAGLPAPGPFSVSAELASFSPADVNPRPGVAAGDTVDFTLSANAGSVTGVVRETGTALPVSGARVTSADGLGRFGRATTGPAGAFAINGLAGGTTTLTTTAAGFAADSRTVLVPPAGSVTVTVDLSRSFGTVAGLVRAVMAPGDTLPVTGETVLFTPVGAVAASLSPVSITTDTLDGTYRVDVSPGRYSITPVVPGHFTLPTATEVAVTTGSVVSGQDFLAYPADIRELRIEGPSDGIRNTGRADFAVTAKTASGQLVPLRVAWSHAPLSAGVMDVDRGQFTPNASYLGEVLVRAVDLGTGASGAKELAVKALLRPAVPDTFVDSLGMVIEFPIGSVSSEVEISLDHEELRNVQRATRAFRAMTVSFDFGPDGEAFLDGGAGFPRLTLPFPLELESPQVGRWDSRRLFWEELGGDIIAAGLVRAPVDHFSEFAVLVSNDPLGIRSVRITPNPFSPSLLPADIQFDLSSDAATAPSVSIRIFNMAGEPVRDLTLNSPTPVGRVEGVFAWDGMTDEGTLARNGRYLVLIEARDGNGDAQSLHTAVLVK